MQEDEEGQDQDQQGSSMPQTANTQSATIGSSASVGGAQPAMATNQQKKPDRPGNFVGIQTYLNANKPQAQKLGENAAGVINTGVQKANEGLQNIQGQFNTKAQAGAFQSNPNALGALQGGAEKLDEEQRNQIRNQAQAQYQGPQDLASVQGFQDVQKQFNQANQNLQGAGTEEGRQNLVKQLGTGKAKTAGMTGFDSMLLQSGGGREKIEQARKAAEGVFNPEAISGANEAAIAKANELKGQTDQARTEAQTAVEAQRKALEKSIQDRLLNTKQQSQKQLEDSILDLQTPESISKQLAESLGLSEGQRTYGVDLQQFLRPGMGSDVNASNIATREEYLRNQALQDLYSSGAPGLLNPDDIDKAGTANTSIFDKDMAQKAIKDRERSYNEALGGVDPNTGRKYADMVEGSDYLKQRSTEMERMKEINDIIDRAPTKTVGKGGSQKSLSPNSLKRIMELYELQSPGQNLSSDNVDANFLRNLQANYRQMVKNNAAEDEKFSQNLGAVRNNFGFNNIINYLKEQG